MYFGLVVFPAERSVLVADSLRLNMWNIELIGMQKFTYSVNLNPFMDHNGAWHFLVSS